MVPCRLVTVWVVCVAIGAVAVAQQRDLKWQTSWEAFVTVLGPEIAPNPVSPGYNQFKGKAVSWEGTLGSIPDTEDLKIRIDMSPTKETHGHIVNVQLLAKSGEFRRWKALPVGAKVRFRGLLDTTFPIMVLRVPGTPIAAVQVGDGELVGQ